MRTIALSLYLTKSRARGDLLALFFLNPEETYYVREMERRLGHSVGTLARELRRFSEEGLLLREARGREILYRLNRTHPLFHEIKGIIEKTQGIPVRLTDELKSLQAVQQAFIYGSFAKGNPGANSDIDLLLVGKETPAFRKLLKQLETKFGRAINATVYSPSEFETKRGDHSEFLFEVMRGPLIQLKPQPSRHGIASAA